jgi:hypothetical protein
MYALQQCYLFKYVSFQGYQIWFEFFLQNDVNLKSILQANFLSAYILFFNIFYLNNIGKKIKQKLWSSGRALGSRSDSCGFNPHPMLDVSGVKAMPGLISTPNSGSL